LAAALEAVREAEQRLAEAKAARAALEPEPDPEQHISRTYGSVAGLHGGTPLGHGLDIGEVAAAVLRQLGGETS
jgi:hypothetical protein